MKRVALLGMPNTGKSTFFNRLTGATARVGNWPGITVDLMTAKIILGSAITQVVDLPGIYSFHGFSEDEKVVRDFLENNPVDLVVIILNATQIDRQLPLALQIVRVDWSTRARVIGAAGAEDRNNNAERVVRRQNPAAFRAME